MSNHSIGSFLAALRKANGLTQKQLAEKLNVSDKAVSRWERDECAPDLSLIPVLAELYGVTSDEILRGRRADPNTAPTPRDEEKSQKRLNYLLNRLKTTHQTRSLITCMIAFIGLIAAMICNLAFNRGYLGFLIGAIFFIAAAVCQTIFRVQSNSALQNEDFDPEAVRDTRHALLRQTQITYSVIILLFAFTLPLLAVPDAYWGLSMVTWLVYGPVCALIAAIACLLVCRTVSRKAGYYTPLSAKTKRRIKAAALLVLVLGITALAHLFAANLLYENMHLYSPGTKFDTFEDFKAWMETPLGPDGQELTLLYSDHWERHYMDSEENYYYADYTEFFLDDPTSGYFDANHTVIHTVCGDNAFYTYTSKQYNHAENIFIAINLCIAIIYPIEIVIAILILRKKNAVDK